MAIELPQVATRPGFSQVAYARPDGNYVVQQDEYGERRSLPAYYVLSPDQYRLYLQHKDCWPLIGVGLRRTRLQREALTVSPNPPTEYQITRLAELTPAT